MQAEVHGKKIKQPQSWRRYVFLVVGWLLILSLARDLWDMRTGFDRVKEVNIRLERETRENEELKMRLESVMTDEHKERLIRDKLNMQKEGEVVVVLPENVGLVPENSDQGEEGDMENWEKWWNLIN